MLTCDLAQRSLSARADGEPADAPVAEVDAHVAGCVECRAFGRRVVEVRQLLRLEPVGELPDIAPSVMARITTPEPRRWWPSVAAAALVGAVAGATFAGAGREPATVAAADLAERVVEVQPAVSSLAADVVVEAGGDVWRGTLRYRAPESLAVILRDADGTLLATVADDDRWWVSGPRRCAPPASSPCAPPTERALVGRTPFADDAPVPVELVSPVDSLSRSAPPTELGTRDIGGRPALGVSVTVGQVAGLLESIDPTGALRPVHPTDPVELWLDDEHLVPVEAVVRAAASPERARWAAGLGLGDDPGAVVLSVRLDDVVIDGDLPDDAFPPAPATATVVDGGFRAGDGGDAPTPADLPAGLDAGRSGTVGDVGVRTWSDGRAWLSVRATRSWDGDRLFGDLGAAVVPLDLGAAGTAYASGDRTRVGLHADDIDVVVTGTVGPAALRRVASSLGLVGVTVPDDWAEASTSTLVEAIAAAPDLLLPGELEGFERPAIRVDGGEVALTYFGAGERSFALVRGAATELPPPLDPDVAAITVRSHPGRWRAATGDLEWVEGGHVRSLRSATIALDELLAIAERLRAP